MVSSGYFEVLRIPLVEGRTFDRRDGSDASLVALVSREAVDRFWPAEEVLGRRIRIGVNPTAPWRRIVGVVANVVGGSDPTSSNVPQIYLPAAQAPRVSMVLLARAAGEETGLAAPIRREVSAIDPQQPVDDVRTMVDVMYDLRSFD